MVTLANTWTTSYNNVPTQTTLGVQGQNVLFALKQALVNAGYVVQASSDSTTSGAADHWSTSASLVWNTAGSAHSWIWFKSPSGMLPSSNQTRVLLDLGTGAANQHLVNIIVASADFTGGSTTTIPTSPGNAIATNNKQYLHSTVTNSKYHYQYVTAGTQVGNFLFEVSEDGTGRFHFAFGFLASQGFETGDGWPVIALTSFSETTTGAIGVTQLGVAASGATYHFDGTMIAGLTLINCEYNNVNDFMGTVTSAGSSVTGNYFDFPVCLADITAGKIALRGYIVDVAWAPTGTSVTSGTVEPSSGSSTTTIIGGWWAPNGNVVPAL